VIEPQEERERIEISYINKRNVGFGDNSEDDVIFTLAGLQDQTK